MNNLARLIKYVLPHRNRLILAAFLTALVSGITGATMLLIKPIIDKVFIAKDTGMLFMILWLVPLMWFIRGIAFYGQAYLLQYVGQRVTLALRGDLFAKLMSLSHDFYNRNSSGKILSRMTNDLYIIQNALLRLPLNFIGDFLTTLVLIGIIFWLNFKFAVIAFVVFPVVALPLVDFARRMRKAAHAGQKQMAEIYNRIQEAVTGISVIKTFRMEERQKAVFEKENTEFYSHQMKFVKVDSRSSPIMEFISAVALTLIIWYGAMDVLKDVWTSGAFFAFLGAAMSIYKPIKNFSSANALLQQTVVSAGRIFEIIDEKPAIADAPGAADFGEFRQAVTLEDVDYYYDHKHPVLKKLNIKISRGEKVALVGPSGAGKTTVAHLVLRFYDACSGRVAIDGVDVRDITLASLRAQMALVTQDIILFNDTIKNNILCGRPGASDEDVREAARRANAADFIESLPDGYETVVGERGALLSGGQKQRVAVARAILKDAPILILDEATSSLDAESEKSVAEAIENLMAEKTVLMIAHRLATIKNADRILVIDDGAVVEEGSHDELVRRQGVYHRICLLQLL
ncbi:MAG: ABC transporter permease [Elusimicrobia bacterium HGW-Elusimicrobia-1]|jgi:subfamily B ATP-binding cassette protein MsbA|nr:MAG: ABC transporter permease [Elusimicrobia bacterium HGW-Elusimicrobia-3]PKN01836.1 MAG: ABC transporter permease [Elusimicrobia bacterium HGW-Elusimicrobia-1]